MNPPTFNVARRAFLQRCTALAAVTGLPLWFIERQELEAAEIPKALGPNDRPGIGVIGCGGMGKGDATNASAFGDILAVCDVDENHAAAFATNFTVDGKVPAVYHDFRKLLERDDIHVIVNATPDHWHTLVNIAAAKAHKDVYAEKPLTLTIDEGRHVVEGRAGQRRRAADRHAAAQLRAIPARVRAGAQRAHREAEAGSGLAPRGPARRALQALADPRRPGLELLAGTDPRGPTTSPSAATGPSASGTSTRAGP